MALSPSVVPVLPITVSLAVSRVIVPSGVPSLQPVSVGTLLWANNGLGVLAGQSQCAAGNGKAVLRSAVDGVR